MRLWTALAALSLLSFGCATTGRPASRDLDKDGIADEKDECPDEPEEAGGNGDGCPDAPKVVLESGHISIRGKIVFDLNSAELLPQNAKLLDVLAQLLTENAQIKRLQIQGHTDDTGEDTFNMQLSVMRADRVKQALVQRGIDAGRLSVKGMGKTMPLASNESDDGRARNRRVEFHVLESL